MKKLIGVMLALCMLVIVVGCGATSSSAPSEPDAVNDPNAYLAELFHGIDKLEERDGAFGEVKIGGGSFVPMRFSHERLAAYEAYNETAKIKAPYFHCTVGVRMDFYTDASTISFHFSIIDGFFDGKPEYAVDTFNIFENGEFMKSVDVVKGSASDLTYTRTSTEPESRITIVFPGYHGVSLSNLQLGNTRPVEDYEHKILVFGDSISQGLFADKPADNYVHQVATALNADYMNLSVGGEVYRADALDENINFEPTHILVALGTNDYYSNMTPAKVKNNADAYFEKLSAIYPDIPVTVIAPFGNIPDVYYENIKEAATPYGYDVIDGTTLISKKVSSWNQDNVHPSTLGFNEITAALTPILQEKLNSK